MKTETIGSLDIIPAYFLRRVGNTVTLACYIGESKPGQPIIQEREFHNLFIEGIKNPTKLLISIEVKPGLIDMICVCGKRYRKPFFWLKAYLK